ncbi:FecR family protein [Dawidia soli]|uniref:FecR domain-containing protein n=1 Tax=Dawidia soli TaxID=2782352 RepID=A0AAP2GK48_9BACT|nr:FecR domain-containing protein [Dawidia soli]MBT1689240.1 FecR domain-containing protein [Dawidia soli]
MDEAAKVDLVRRFLDNTLDPAERQGVMAMLRTGAGNVEEILRMELDRRFMGYFDDPATLPLSADERRRGDHARRRVYKKIMRPAAKRRWLELWHLQVAAACIITLLVTGSWIFRKSSHTNVLPGPLLTELKVYQGKQPIYLPDGSIVVLKPGSELQFNAADFGKKERVVKLDGEAFFDIHHDAAHPFIVQTATIATRVLGTSFNVRTFRDHRQAEVAVTRGLVEVHHVVEGKSFGKVAPGELLVVDLETNTARKQAIDHNSAVWRQHLVVFNNVKMESAARMLEERFSVHIAFDHEGLKQCEPFTAAFYPSDDLDQVLTAIMKLYTTNARKKGYTHDAVHKSVVLHSACRQY